MHKSFAALILGYANGDAMDMSHVVEEFGIKLIGVEDYARSVLARTTAT